MKGDPRRPAYARVLRLNYLHPGGLLCFVFFEGMILLAVLLALAELVTWWVVIILPASVAAMVKINDVIAGLSVRQPGQKSLLPRRAPAVARGSAAVNPEVRGAPQRTNPATGRVTGVRGTGPDDGGRAVGTAPAPGGPGRSRPSAGPNGPHRMGDRPGAAGPVSPAAAGDPAGGLAGELGPSRPLRRAIWPNQRRFERPL